MSDARKTFPGHAYAEDGTPLTVDAPELTQRRLDTTPHKSVVLADPDNEDPDAALVWVLDPAARYETVPSEHIVMATDAATAGRDVILVSDGAEAVESVGDGLFDLFELIRHPGNGMPQA